MNFIPTGIIRTMGLAARVFVIIPLAVFAAVIFGFGIYNTLCKNANVPLFDC